MSGIYTHESPFLAPPLNERNFEQSELNPLDFCHGEVQPVFSANQKLSEVQEYSYQQNRKLANKNPYQNLVESSFSVLIS